MLKRFHPFVHRRAVTCIAPGVDEGEIESLAWHDFFCILESIGVYDPYLFGMLEIGKNILLEYSDHILRQLHYSDALDVWLSMYHIGVISESETKGDDLAMRLVYRLVAGVNVDGGQCHPFVAILEDCKE